MRGINPQAVIVAVGRTHEVEGLAGVDGAIDSSVQDVEGVGIFRVSEDVMEIPGALGEAVVAVDEMPGVTAVVAAVNASLRGFDDGVNPVAIRAGDGHADAAEDAFRQAVAFETLPGVAAVGGFVEAAAGAATREAPGRALGFPERRVQDARILRVGVEIDGAGLVVLEENFLPGFPAVGGAKDAARVVRAIGVAESGNVHEVGIFRMHEDARDVLRVFEADVRPGLSGVSGLVHAVAVGDVAADAGFAGANVDDVGVRRSDGDRADGHDGGLVRERRPRRAAVHGLPDAASDGAEVIRIRIACDAGHGKRAAAAEGSNLAPLHCFQRIFVERLRERANGKNSAHAENKKTLVEHCRLRSTTHRSPLKN